MKILLIGKNSSIVNAIKTRLESFDLVSHKELDNLDVSLYDRVFVFSWCSTSLQENLLLLKKLELNKVIFISTIAVLSCAQRTQWASYPNMKLFCENHVLRYGGKVIRIGIWDSASLEHLPNMVPFTTSERLISSMYESLHSEKRILWPIQLTQGNLSGFKLSLSCMFTRLSDVLPSLRLFQVPLVIVSKLLGLKYYGYTYDCLKYFSKRVLVGFGAVGSAISKELDLRGLNHTIVTSVDDDELLNTNGFRGLRIGRYREGLSRLWHGVRITQQNAEDFYKSVPFIVSRSRVPRGVIFGRVIRLDLDSSMSSILIQHPVVEDVRCFAEVIHLAAGVLNNVKILQATHPINATFSDHEIAEIGKVSTNDLVTRHFIKRYFGMIRGRKVLKGKCGEIEYILDFRPAASNTIAFDAENIYNNRTDQILCKLFQSMSLSLVNQAFFNKFGFSFDVGSFCVVIQAEAPNCIDLNKNGVLTRKRLSANVFDEINEDILKIFPTFNKTYAPLSFDAIHVHGGFAIKSFPDLDKLVSEKRLFLHGNVLDGRPLGPFHNTVEMIRRECEVIDSV